MFYGPNVEFFFYLGLQLSSSNIMLAAVGHYCEFEESAAARTSRETCGSLSDYLGELSTAGPMCESGEPGILTWTPDEDTPNVVYYQVSSDTVIT